MQKLPVAILGATGAVGQRFIQLLENHPWFEVAEVIGSDRSAGQLYGDYTRWVLNGDIPEKVRNLRVKGIDEPVNSPVVFSAVPKEAAEVTELRLAEAGHIVCTNASTNRMVEDIPLLLPEANADHIQLIDIQRKNRGWTTGALIANSNCTAMPIVMSLAPLRKFGIKRLITVSAQAISGAGYPGVPSLDIIDNIVPYIGGEEDKVETEPLRMLGKFNGETVDWLPAIASATCTRASVIDGHIVHLSIELEAKPDMGEIIHTWDTFRAENPVPSLPSAPKQPTIYLRQPDRPQPRRDRDAGNGMTTTIGRLRECPILGYKFVTLSHNTVRGAAGCSILNAELLAAKGYIHHFQPDLIAEPVN